MKQQLSSEPAADTATASAVAISDTSAATKETLEDYTLRFAPRHWPTTRPATTSTLT